MKKTGLLLFFSLIVSITFAEQSFKPIPLDKAIRYGKLSNGLTYYIRHNEQPKDRAEFFIAQNVGAILEEDTQNGLAHFLEHMAFNGTKNYPGKTLINYFETIGVRFGQNINAYTSLDETVYNLSEVPTNREGIIDSALLVLHDWSNFITLNDTEIDKERGVIREEWRESQNANRRIWKESNKVIMAGSQYAKRDILGDTAVINHFPYQILKNYYKKWYRPDLQAILIVGDIDVDQVEAKIKDLFSDIPAVENGAERTYFEIPDNDEPIVGVFTDPEMETMQNILYFKQNPVPDNIKRSDQGYAYSLITSLISSMTNQRLDEIRQEAGSPFTGIYSGIGDLTKTKDVYAFICEPATGKEKAARERMLLEAESIKRFGFTSTELERAKAEILSSYEKSYNERGQQKNNTLVREYVRNFLSAEPAPGIEWEYEFVNKNLPSIPLDIVNQIAKNFLIGKNIIFTINGPAKPNLNYPSNEELKQEILASRTAEIKAYQDSVSTDPLISRPLTPGAVRETKSNEVLGTTEWKLSNGIKVIFKPTKFKEDEIRMSAWSEGGLSLLPLKDLASGMFTASVISQSGLGQFNQSDLNKKLTGKIASVGPRIGNYDEGLNGSSSVKDLETMLQLTYLYFTAPRKDENTYQYVMKSIKTYLENAASNPENAYSDSITTILYGNNPRVLLTNMETMAKVDYASIQRIYKERFANPADFTFQFIGNIDEKTFKPLVEKYLGSLTTTKNGENWKDNLIRKQKGQLYREIVKPLKISKTTNHILYSFEIPYTMNNRVALRALANLLDLRYTATIREEEGASYGVGVNGYLLNIPIQTGELVIDFNTDPKLEQDMLKIIHAEINSLAENGPKPEDLNKVKLNLLKQHKEDIAENGWWMQALSAFYRDGLNYITDYEKAVEALDSSSMKTLTKTILSQKNCAEILLVPEKK